MARAGDTIGPYRVVRRLGVGGMAEAFEAERELSPRCVLSVCVKRLLPAYAEDAEYVAAFRREAALASLLRHPNVVSVLDAGVDAGTPYLVLELVDGIDLRTLLAQEPTHRLPEGEVLYLAGELAHALDHAHTADGERPAVVHRDVTSANVLLGGGGEVKLADFGIAKPMAGGPVTRSNTVRGTIPYLAPEQMRAEAVDGRADLFSLGVVLYECLAGTRPFDGVHEVDTMTRILGDRRRPLRELAPHVSPAFAAIVDGLLAADPEARPASAYALIEALDALPSPAVFRFALLDRVVANRDRSRERRSSVPPVAAPPKPHEEPEQKDPQASARRRTEDEPTAPRRRPREVPSASPSTPGPSHATPPLAQEAPPVVATTSSSTRAGVDASRSPSGAVPATHAARRWSLGAATIALALASTAIVIAARAPAEGTNPRDSHRDAARATAADAPRGGAPSPAPTRNEAISTAPATTEAAVPRHAVDAPPPIARARTEGTVASQTALPPRADAPAEPTGTRAMVRVVVVPWGRVWIDGVARGRAPLFVAVAPGTHRIEAGQDAPTIGRRVRLDAGETRTVELELGAPTTDETSTAR